MPTGYTAGIQDGKIETLEQYALVCARAFGALIMMRDDPHDAPIPEEFKPETSYDDEHIAAANALLAELPGLSDAECEKRAVDEHADELASYVKYEASKDASRRRYGDMRYRVRDWRVPPGLQSLKDFMISQIDDSLKFDCVKSYRDEPVRKTGAEWKAAAMASASHDLAYHSLARQKALDRTAERNKWLADLRAALRGAP